MEAKITPEQIAESLVTLHKTPILKRKDIFNYADNAGMLVKDIYRTLLKVENRVGKGNYTLQPYLSKDFKYSNDVLSDDSVDTPTKNMTHDEWVQYNIKHHTARRKRANKG